MRAVILSKPVILRRKPKNLGVLALFTVFLFVVKPSFAVTTSRLAIPVSSNAMLVVQNENGIVSQTAIISDSLSSTKVILSSDGSTISTPSYYPYGAERERV